MALTRSFLKGMSITDEQVSAIIEAHAESIDALKEQRDQYRDDAEKLKAVQKELDGLKALKGDDWKAKYESEHEAFEQYKSAQEEAIGKVTSEFEQYKTAQAEKETASAKREAYKRLLSEAGISEKRMDAILKVTDLSDITLNADGSIRNSEKMSEGIKSEWSDFISTSSVVGAKVDAPPAASAKAGLTRESIMQIADRAERRKAIAENPAIFGKE